MLKKKIFASAIALFVMFGVVGTIHAFTFDSAIDTPAEKVALQTVLNAVNVPSPMLATDGVIGAKTIAAVKVFQAAKSLDVDGVVGAMTRAALNAAQAGGSTGTFPAGCTSAAGFSTTTGISCATVSTLPAGCMSAIGFSPTTGASCAGGSTGGALTGGAGEAEVTHYSTSEKSSIKEGEEDVKVLGFKVEAVDSDVAVNFVKVEVSNTNYDDGVDPSSEKVTNYIDSIDIYKGSTKVGSVDADDLSKTTGDPDTYSKSIAISNATVKEGDKDAFYVVFNAAGSIDSDYMAAVLTVEVVSVRIQDASGAILTAEPALTVDNDVSFADAGDDDDIQLKSSSANPDDATITVDANDATDEELALAFKLDVGDDSSDITITEIPVDVVIASSGASSSEEVIDSVVLKMDGKEYTADVTDDTVGAAVYTFDLTDEDVVLSAGDVVEGKVYVTFLEQDGNYDEDTTVVVSLANESISAETDSDDTFGVDGNDQDGGTLTLSLDTVTISDFKWTINSTGTIADFEFTVKAEDGDFNVLSAEILDTVTGTATITDTGYTPVTSDLGVLSRKTGDTVVAVGTTGFTVAEGDTTTFKVRYSLDTTTNGLWAEVAVTSVAGQNVPDDKEVSPTVTVNIN